MVTRPHIKKCKNDDRPSIGRYIGSIHRHIHIVIQQMLKPYGMGSGQCFFMNVICHHEGLSQKELSEIMHIDKATTTKALKKLVQGGWVERKADPNDGRQYQLFLTDKGQAFMPTFHGILDQITDGLSKGYEEEEYQKVIAMMDQLQANVVQMVEDVKQRDTSPRGDHE